MSVSTRARIFIVALIAIAVPQGAFAQSDRCTRLNAELARIDKAGVAIDPLSDAMLRQRASLQKATSDYQRLCGGGLFGGQAVQCPSLEARIGEMQANLDKLERMTQRAGTQAAASPASLAGDRARILTAMRQSGCPQIDGPVAAPSQPAPRSPQNTPISAGRGSERFFMMQTPNGPMMYREDASGRIMPVGPPLAGQRQAGIQAPPPPSSPPPSQGGFLGALFGNRPVAGETIEDPYASDPGADVVPGSQDLAEENTPFRTLCVRMCDGYYFPISYATTPSRFGTDLDICRARCPGAETRLFVHKTAEDSETAVAADGSGEAYTRIPNALKYRTQFVSGCGCGRADPALLPMNSSLDEGASSASNTVRIGDLRTDLPIPREKPEIDEDPETIANALARFVPTPVEVQSNVQGAEAPRSVRIVGPKFFVAR